MSTGIPETPLRPLALTRVRRPGDEALVKLWEDAIAAGAKPLDLWLNERGRAQFATRESIEQRLKVRKVKARFAETMESLLLKEPK